MSAGLKGTLTGLALALMAGLGAPASAAPKLPAPGEAPVKVFEALNGQWKGTFTGYDAAGNALYRIKVEQRYTTLDARNQQVLIEDRMPDGKVIQGKGRNTATRNPDGSISLRCVVEKSNGERVEHTGRLIEGPRGDTQIIWYSKAPDRTETFRETVRVVDGKPVYQIDGMGQYGETLILMAGRYEKVIEEDNGDPK